MNTSKLLITVCKGRKGKKECGQKILGTDLIKLITGKSGRDYEIYQCTKCKAVYVGRLPIETFL